MLLKNRLQRELHSISKKFNPRKIVFSSELIQSRITEIEDLVRLRTFLFEVGLTNIKIVVYLRDQADIAQSLYSTAIKAGHAWDVPPTPDDCYFRNVCNHKATIERFQTVFGDSNIIPRIFERSKLVEKSIIYDFFDVVDEHVDADYEFLENANESLSYTGLKLLCEVNKKGDVKKNDIENFKNRELVRYFERYLSSSKYRIPESLRSEYNTAFKDSNEWVRASFFPNEDNLFTQRENSFSDLDEININEIAGLVEALWKGNYTLFNKNKVRLMLKSIKLKVLKLLDLIDALGFIFLSKHKDK